MNPLLSKAIKISIKAHEGQVDKAGQPYHLHPLRVMESCCDVDTKIVAVLHDVIEDTDITFDILRAEGFSQYILDGIDGVTRRQGESYNQFIKRCKLNPTSKIVKLADLKEVASYIERVEALDKYDKEISKYTLEYLLVDLEFYSNHELYSNGYQAEKLRTEIKNRLAGLYK